MNDKVQDTFKAWGVIDLFGHQRIAGEITEQNIGGCNFVRVDVPKIRDIPSYTRFFGNGAIYSITVTTEEVALAVARNLGARPIQPYEMPKLIPFPETDGCAAE